MGVGQALVRVGDAAEKLATKLGDSLRDLRAPALRPLPTTRRTPAASSSPRASRASASRRPTTTCGDERVTSQDLPEFEALSKYGRNVTDMARQGKLDPVIGRVEEIRRTIQVRSAAARTTRCSSASPALARRPSSRPLPSASSTATCPPRCARQGACRA